MPRKMVEFASTLLKREKKMKNMPSGSEGTDAGLKWILFEKMTFIDAVVKPRK